MNNDLKWLHLRYTGRERRGTFSIWTTLGNSHQHWARKCSRESRGDGLWRDGTGNPQFKKGYFHCAIHLPMVLIVHPSRKIDLVLFTPSSLVMPIIQVQSCSGVHQTYHWVTYFPPSRCWSLCRVTNRWIAESLRRLIDQPSKAFPV
jgi:hypothetical protein